MKKKVIISAIGVVLVLTMALALFVACNEDDQKTQSPESYTITFVDGETVVSTSSIESGSAVTADQIPNGPEHSGKIFDGWYVGETKVEAGYKPQSDVTAQAKYHDDTPTMYTVSFSLGEYTEGTAPASVQVQAGGTVELPIVEWPEHSLLGWKANNEGETIAAQTTVTVNANVTYYAIWSEGPGETIYTITFLDPDGNQLGDPINVGAVWRTPEGMYFGEHPLEMGQTWGWYLWSNGEYGAQIDPQSYDGEENIVVKIKISSYEPATLPASYQGMWQGESDIVGLCSILIDGEDITLTMNDEEPVEVLGVYENPAGGYYLAVPTGVEDPAYNYYTLNLVDSKLIFHFIPSDTEDYEIELDKMLTVKFYNAADLLETKYVAPNTPVSAPAQNPESEMLTFHYWIYRNVGGEYDFSAPVTEDLELEAQFDIYITFNLNGGTGTIPEGIWAKSYKNADLPTDDGFSNGDKVFAGWKNMEGGVTYESGDSVRFSASVELYAQWDDPKSTYTVTYFCGYAEGTANYNNMQGTTPDPFAVEAGQEIELIANPWKLAGYHFTGYKIQHEDEDINSNTLGSATQSNIVWKDIEGETGKQPGSKYVVNENIRIVAQWATSTVTIKYDPNGGSGSIDNTTTSYSTGSNTTIILPEQHFMAPEGKVFVGWSLTNNGATLEVTNLSNKDRIYFRDIKDSLVLLDNGDYELTLYAIWGDIPLQISEIQGVWSYNGKQAIISDVVVCDLYENAVGSIIIDNEYILLYRQDNNQFYGYAQYSEHDVYIVTYANEKLKIDENEYTGKTAISNANKSDFIGKWQRTGSSQIWDIQESTAILSMNSANTTADAYVIIDKYLVLEYEKNYFVYQFLLTKQDTDLVGYYTESEKAPAATTFTPYSESAGGGGDEDPITKSGYYPESDDTIAEYLAGAVKKKTYKILWFEIEGTTIKYSFSIDGEVQQDAETSLSKQSKNYFKEGTYPDGERTDYIATIGTQIGIIVYEDGTAYVLDYTTEEILTSNKYIHKDANA